MVFDMVVLIGMLAGTLATQARRYSTKERSIVSPRTSGYSSSVRLKLNPPTPFSSAVVSSVICQNELKIVLGGTDRLSECTAPCRSAVA